MLINDLLASGEIPDLFQDDELETVINGVRNEVKGAGLQDTKENCWSFFIDRVRRQLKVSVSVYVDVAVPGRNRTLFRCVLLRSIRCSLELSLRAGLIHSGLTHEYLPRLHSTYEPHL